MKKLTVLIFIDAFGWEIYEHYGFLKEFFPYSKPLKTVFGYSSAAVPSIMTGRYPVEHTHWSSFFYAPEDSPFKPLKKLRFLPKSLMNRGRVRNLISKWVAHRNQYTGYFTLGNIPFEYLPYFDYLEKQDYFVPGGIIQTDTILDYLSENQIPYHCSDWRLSEAENVSALKANLKKDIQFAFLYLPTLDGLMHQVGPEAIEVENKLNWYAQEIAKLIEQAEKEYDLSLYLCSDHGMKQCTLSVDLMPLIQNTSLEFGKDYTAVYDSTMARFWFLNPAAREQIINALEQCSEGEWLSQEQLRTWGCYFEDGRFGQEIFLLKPGVLIAPSFMNQGFVTGMHGYTPDDSGSDALLLSQQRIPDAVQSITDIRHLIQQEVCSHV